MDSNTTKPKRGRSAYILFCTKKRAMLKTEFPELNDRELSLKFGELWSAATSAEQEPYVVEAAKEKKEQDAAIAAYKKALYDAELAAAEERSVKATKLSTKDVANMSESEGRRFIEEALVVFCTGLKTRVVGYQETLDILEGVNVDKGEIRRLRAMVTKKQIESDEIASQLLLPNDIHALQSMALRVDEAMGSEVMFSHVITAFRVYGEAIIAKSPFQERKFLESGADDPSSRNGARERFGEHDLNIWGPPGCFPLGTKVSHVEHGIGRVVAVGWADPYYRGEELVCYVISNEGSSLISVVPCMCLQWKFAGGFGPGDHLPWIVPKGQFTPEEYTMMHNADQVSATKHFCQTCLKPNSRLKCVACRASFYCSDECQNQDWNLHKEHCKSFKGRAPGVSLYDSCAICRESLWDEEGKATESRGTVA